MPKLHRFLMYCNNKYDKGPEANPVKSSKQVIGLLKSSYLFRENMEGEIFNFCSLGQKKLSESIRRAL